MKTYRTIQALIALLLLSMPSFSQWEVPEKKQKANPPFIFNRQSVKDGKVIYYKHCSSCHGDIGKANFQPLTPAPGDLGSAQTEINPDGGLFYKISTGKGLMPVFKDVLTDNEKWQTISYMRNFHTNYVQKLNVEAKAEKWTGGEIIFQISNLESSKKCRIKLTGDNGEKFIPIEGASIGIFTERMFGTMQIGQTLETDEYGFASLPFPENLPGDEEGNLNITVKLLDDDIYGEVSTTEILKIGKPKQVTNILEGTPIWSANKVPFWILFSYVGIILLMWGAMIYVLLSILKIKKYNI